MRGRGVGPVLVLLVIVATGVLAGAAIPVLPAGRGLELRTVDWRTRLFSDPARADPSIVVVDIDESSLQSLEPAVGRWPWPRQVHGLVVDALRAAGARLILYDVLFIERDLDAPTSDRKLVESVAPGDVLLAWQGHRERVGHDEEPIGLVPLGTFPGGDTDTFPGRLVPFRELAEAAGDLGAVNVALDEDGIVRRGILTVRSGEKAYASLPLLGASRLLEAHPKFAEDHLILESRREDVPDVHVPVDSKGRLFLRFRAAPDAYPHVSFGNVLYAWGEALRGKPSSLDWSLFRNRVVIVSATASGLFDQHSGPYPQELPGGELLATTLDNLLSGDALRETPLPWKRVAVVALAFATGVVMMTTGAAVGTLGAVALTAGWVAVAVSAFGVQGRVLPLLAPTVAGVTSAGLAGAWRYATEGRERRRMRALFSRYASDAVVTRLVDAPDAVNLGGDETEVTVLFSDIRGFTSHAERMTPTALMEQLNEYFAAVTEAIFREEGIVDKFIGDAVMAVFGAPLPQKDHASRAVRAALGMHAAVEQLNATWRVEGRPAWSIGVGIATGPAVVGNVGSERRTEFTVIGDTVNLASRLEGENKRLGTGVLIAGATARSLDGRFNLRGHGEIRVRGKDQAVAIFEVPTTGGVS